MKRITRNAAQCAKCGDLIVSKHRHDFVWCKCKSIAVDGGLTYLKRTGELQNIIEKSEYVEIKDPCGND
jgi:hypothetical protein